MDFILAAGIIMVLVGSWLEGTQVMPLWGTILIALGLAICIRQALKKKNKN